MPRQLAATTLVGRIREYFGLDQAALALYMGVSPALVQHLDSGRRRLTGAAFMALQPLAAQLAAATAAPAPPETTPAFAFPPGTPAPDLAELDFRRRVCQQQALRLGKELAALEQHARVAARWTQALPALLQAAADLTPADPERTTWLTDWLGRQARPLPAAAVTRCYLLRARLAALAAEVAALSSPAAV